MSHLPTGSGELAPPFLRGEGPPLSSLLCGHLDTHVSSFASPLASRTMGPPPQPSPAAPTRTCTKCRQELPLSQFQSRAISGQVTKSCLNCRTGVPYPRLSRDQPTRTGARAEREQSVASSYATRSSIASSADPPTAPLDTTQQWDATVGVIRPAAHVPPLLSGVSTQLPPPPAPFAPMPTDLFVTSSALEERLHLTTSSITAAVMEPIQALQSQLSAIASSLSALQPTTDGTAPNTASSATAGIPPPAPAAGPVPYPGESTVQRVYFWVSSELADLVYADRLKPFDLGKLRPSSSTTAPSPAGQTTVTVAGIEIGVPNHNTGAPVKAFLKAVPSVVAFCQAWAIYMTLRTAASNDRTLGPALGGFMVHVIDLDQYYNWPDVANYVLAVCEKRFGHADAATWAERDIVLQQDRLGHAVPKVAKSISSNSSNQSGSKKASSSPEVCL